MVDEGVFSLGSGERAEFLDKFRMGSYLQIQQINVDPRVFDTVWSIRRKRKDTDETIFFRQETISRHWKIQE